MTKVKSFFRSTSDCLKSTFQHSRCLLTISVGQATHESEIFASTMELVNKSFNSCVLLIDDSLQRHTMALDKPEDASFFYEKSIEEGKLWLQRNHVYYSRLTIPTKIIHWDMWLNHINYASQKKAIMDLLETDFSYKEAFYSSIEQFLKKYYARLPELKKEKFSMERARQLSFDFVLEECTALCLWPELECHFELYPNKHNAAIEQTRKIFISKNYPDLLQALTIGFKNLKQIEPQQFVMLN